MEESRLYLDPSRPRKCDKCQEKDIIYLGLGGYKCKNCNNIMYDDYGKVREYLDAHKGATASEVSFETGVSQAKIRQMIKEERLEIAENSNMFLNCEACGVSIRSGYLCPTCAKLREAVLKREDRRKTAKEMQGVSMHIEGDSGAKRFSRD